MPVLTGLKLILNRNELLLNQGLSDLAQCFES